VETHNAAVQTVGTAAETHTAAVQTVGTAVETWGTKLTSVGTDVETQATDPTSVGTDVETQGTELTSVGTDLTSVGTNGATVGTAVEREDYDRTGASAPVSLTYSAYPPPYLCAPFGPSSMTRFERARRKRRSWDTKSIVPS